MRWPMFRRRKFIVNRFQNRLLLVYLVHFGAVTFISLGIFLAVVMARLDNTSLSLAQRQEVGKLLHGFSWQLWPTFTAILIALVLHSTLVTHRVAGPLFKLRDALKRIGEGDLSQHIRLRRTDYLREEAEVVNAMTDTLRRKFAAVKDEQAALESALKEMGQAIEGGSIGEMRRTHAVLKGRVGCLRRELETFIVKTAEGEAERQASAVHTYRQPEDQETYETVT